MEFVSPEGLRLDGRRPMEVYYLSLSLSLSLAFVFAYSHVFSTFVVCSLIFTFDDR